MDKEIFTTCERLFKLSIGEKVFKFIIQEEHDKVRSLRVSENFLKINVDITKFISKEKNKYIYNQVLFPKIINENNLKITKIFEENLKNMENYLVNKKYQRIDKSVLKETIFFSNKLKDCNKTIYLKLERDIERYFDSIVLKKSTSLNLLKNSMFFGSIKQYSLYSIKHSILNLIFIENQEELEQVFN